MHTNVVWKRSLHPVRAAAAGAVLVIGLSFMTVTPASAASCAGDSCSGQDPVATGCAADAVTIATREGQDFTLETRSSPSCQTRWAKVSLRPVTWKNFSWKYTGKLTARQDTAYSQTTKFNVFTGMTMTAWTPMIFSPNRCVKSTWQYTSTKCK